MRRSAAVSGQYHDAETDLFQNWNRFYDPSIGRYLEPDPLWLYPEKLVPLAQKGRTAPVYAYAGNNPINGVDPDGLLEVEVTGKDEEKKKAALEEIEAARNDPVTGPEVAKLEADPKYKVTIDADATMGSSLNGQTKATDDGAQIRVRGNEPITQSDDGNGQKIVSNEKTTVSHELGHAMDLFQNDNKNIDIPSQKFKTPEMKEQNNNKAIQYDNRSRMRQNLPLKHSHPR